MFWTELNMLENLRSKFDDSWGKGSGYASTVVCTMRCLTTAGIQRVYSHSERLHSKAEMKTFLLLGHFSLNDWRSVALQKERERWRVTRHKWRTCRPSRRPLSITVLMEKPPPVGWYDVSAISVPVCFSMRTCTEIWQLFYVLQPFQMEIRTERICMILCWREKPVTHILTPQPSDSGEGFRKTKEVKPITFYVPSYCKQQRPAVVHA